MDKLKIDQLHKLRLSIFDNAESLYKEAKLLNENGFYERAYLLAYFACEELGKIPIVVGAIGQLIQGNEVDWKKVKKRFRNHKAKVESEDYHHYVFGLEPDLLRNSDVKWLDEQKKQSRAKVDRKNESTYVDVIDGDIMLPAEQVSSEDAVKLIERAFNSLKAHWQSESLTNPIIVVANAANSADAKKPRG